MCRRGEDKDKRLVGRGGLKLEAALDRFQLAPLIRGAHAVDVGASTGGFTQVLLDSGATDVVCVDAGHGQLHERLRRDPRVRNLENTDWKHLSLSEAPGPFDFFTVDVSFVAARNMLRGLAFRLRPGAQGVVLVKPQFELPDHLVRQGDVSDPGLRRKALAAFRKARQRAWASGWSRTPTRQWPAARGPSRSSPISSSTAGRESSPSPGRNDQPIPHRPRRGRKK